MYISSYRYFSDDDDLTQNKILSFLSRLIGKSNLLFNNIYQTCLLKNVYNPKSAPIYHVYRYIRPMTSALNPLYNK